MKSPMRNQWRSPMKNQVYESQLQVDKRICCSNYRRNETRSVSDAYTDWQSLSEQQKRIERISPKTRPYRVNCPIAHTEYTESKWVPTDLQSLIEKQWANGMRDIQATSRVHESIYYQGELVRNSLPQMIATFGSRINPTIWYSMCVQERGATRMQWSYSTCNTMKSCRRTIKLWNWTNHPV